MTKEAQSKDVFTPPNHQQLRFVEGEDAFGKVLEDGGNFFITGADVINPNVDLAPEVEEIQEEKDDSSDDQTFPKDLSM